MSHHNPNGGYRQPYMVAPAKQYPYGGQIPQLHIDTVPEEPWPSYQRPRSAQDGRNRRPSPSASVNTTRNMSQPTGSNRMNYPQANPSPVDSGVGFDVPRDLSLLDPSYVPHYYDTSGSRGPEPAWSPFNLRNPQSGGAHGPLRQSNMDFRFTCGPRSDVDSQALPSDEGYFSRNTQSVMSNEPDHVNQELPANFMSTINSMRVESVASEAPTMSRMPSDQRSFVSSRSGKSRKEYPCPQCPEVLKCNSEFKKHKLKHDKPFKCEVSGCKRTEGFTTTNDLDRHQRSLHRKDIDKKSYKCAIENCRNKEKLWPRLDNFKQHVERMHKDEDVHDVIQRSIWHPRNVDSPMEEEASVAPMDIDHAVSGMEIPFSANPTMGISPVLEFPTSQGARHSFSCGQGSDFVGNVNTLSRQFRGGPTSAPHNARIQKVQKMTRPRHHAPGLSAPRIQTPLLTTKTASGASGRSGFKAQQSFPDSALSNAPQTKAEQQKELKKKSERQSHSPSPVDLESLMLEMIQKAKDQAKCDDKSAEQSKPEKNAALMEELSKLFNKGPGSSHTGQRRSSKDPAHNDKKCPQPNCGFAVARECDLRKHIKRHNRPYGCTYPKCHKRFGAKSDWKRHENSQHFQQEAFRCAQPLQSGEICGVHLHREGAFRNHLETQHKIPGENAQKHVNYSRIGKNCQGSFWCGLCRAVVQLKERRNAAWDERFDHIAHHFEKDTPKRSIDEWICAEENRSKKELLEEKMKRDYFDNENEKEKEGDVDAAGDDDDAQPHPQPPPHNMPDLFLRTQVLPSPPAGDVAPGPGPKRPRSEDSTYDSRPPKRRQTKIVTNRYCCTCQSPCGVVDVACANCAHQVCTNCGVEQMDAFNVLDFYCED